MIDLKTTTFFGLIAGELQKATNVDLNLDRFCYLLGQLFQIRDDYINLKDEGYQKLKGFAEDLTEGKFSFPLIHGIRKDPKDTTILSRFAFEVQIFFVCFYAANLLILSLSSGILKMHTQNDGLKRMVIKKLEDLGSFEYTKNYLDELEAELKAELAKFEPNPLMEDALKPILFNYIV